MPVPTWLATDPVEPKLPPRVRPGWAPRPNKKVKLVKGWQVPEGAGQEADPDLTQHLGGAAIPSIAPTPEPTVQYTPDQPLQVTRYQSPAASPTGPSLGQMEDLYGGGAQPSTSGIDTAADPTAIYDTTDMSASGSQLGPGPQSKTPGDWIDQARQAAIAEGLDPDVFTRQIQQESGFNPNAKSPAGAIGIAQIMPETAKAWGVDPNDPKASLRAAAKADRQYLSDYGGDYRLMLAAYNAGPGAVAKYGGVPPYEETQNYVHAIYGSGSSVGAKSAGGRGSGGGNSIISVARGATGSQYKFGGAGGRNNQAALSPTDCSGFVSWAYRQGAGIKLPAQTSAIWDSTIAIDSAQARPGDLVMFNMDSKSDHLQHVGIYMGGGQMIHDSSANPNGGVDVTPLWSNPSFRRVPGATPEQLHGVTPSSNDFEALQRPTRDKVVSWSVVAHGGRQMLVGKYASGKALSRDLGKTTKPDGTVLSSMTPQAQAAAQGPVSSSAAPAENGEEAQPEQQPDQDAGAGQEAKPSGSPLEQALRAMIDEAISARMGAGQDEGDDTTQWAPGALGGYQIPTAADVIDAQRIWATPGQGYQIPTTADVIDLQEQQQAVREQQQAQKDAQAAQNRAALENQRRGEQLSAYQNVINTPGMGYQVPTTADVIDAQEAADRQAREDAQKASDAAKASGSPYGTRTGVTLDPRTWIDAGPSAIEATKQRLGAALANEPDDAHNFLAGSQPDSPIAQAGKKLGAAASVVGTIGQTITSPISPQSEEFPTGGPASGPVVGLARQNAGYEQLNNENPHYAELTKERQDLIDQLPQNATAVKMQGGPEAERIESIQDRIQEIDQERRQIASTYNLDELAARNPNIGAIEAQSGIIQGLAAAGAGAVLDVAGAPGLVKNVVQAGIDPMTGLPNTPAELLKLRQPAKATVDMALGGVPGVVSKVVGKGGAATKAAEAVERADSLPASETAIRSLTEGRQPLLGQLAQPVKQVFEDDSADLAGFQQQLKKDAGLPDVVTAYRRKGTAAAEDQATYSLRRPDLPVDQIETVSVPRSSIIGLGDPNAAEIVAKTADIKQATSMEKYVAAGSQLRHAITGPVSDALEAALKAPVTDAERADAQALLDQFAQQGGTKGRPFAPYPKATSADTFALTLRQLRTLADLGASEKDWYQVSSRAILEATGGNREDAETIAKLVAIYSPNTPVSNNMDYAMTAWHQFHAGVPIDAPTLGANNERASQLLYGKKEWDGVKTNNFYRNLMKEINPDKYVQLGQVSEKGVRQTGVTIDIWMQRALDSLRKAPSTQAQYDFAAAAVNKIAAEHGWTPEQAQAAIWSAAKQGWENQKSAKAMEEAGYNYGTALVDRTTHGWGIDAKTAAAFHDANGQDPVARALNLLGKDGKVALPQARQTRESKDVFYDIATGKELSAKEAKGRPPSEIAGGVGRVQQQARDAMNAYTAFRAKLTGASEAGWARVWNPKSLPISKANAMVVDTGRPLTNAELDQLEAHLDAQFGAGKTKVLQTNHGAWVLGLEGTAGEELHNGVDRGLEGLQSVENARTAPALHDSEFHTNDWSAHPNGESYQDVIDRTGHTARLRELEGVLRPQIEDARAAAARGEDPATLRGAARGAAEAPQGLTPEEREAAIRDALPPEVRDTPAGQAMVKQVAAASDPVPYLEQLADAGKLPVEHTVVDMHVPPIGNKRPRPLRGVKAQTATEQQHALQTAALDLNDRTLEQDARTAAAAGKHEPLGPQRLRQAIVGAIQRQNPGLGLEQVFRKADDLLNKSAASREPGFAATGYALRLAGGAAGGAVGEQAAEHHVAEDDPNRPLKLAAGALVGGAIGIGLPYLTGFVDKSIMKPTVEYAEEAGIAPVLQRSPQYQQLHQELTGGVQAATLAGQLFTEKLEQAFRGQLDAAEVSHWELHNAVSPKWAGNPAAQAAFKEWQDIAQWAPKYLQLNKKIDFANPANAANLYVPHVVDEEWRNAQKAFATTGKATGTTGRIGMSKNPFWQYKQGRQFDTMADGVTAGIKYTDDQARSLGMYYARALQEKALQNYGKGMTKLAKSKADPELRYFGAKDLAKSGEPLDRLLPGRLKGVHADPKLASVVEATLGTRSVTNPIMKFEQNALSTLGALKHNMFGLSGFHGLNVTRQFGTSLPGMYAQYGLKGVPVLEHLPGATSTAAKYARFAGELPYTPVRFAQEMGMAVSHVATPGSWRAFRLRETPGMLEAARDGLTLSMNTAHAMNWKRQMAVTLFNSIGGGVSGYGLGQSLGASPEDSLKMAAGGAVAGALTGVHVPGTSASIIGHVNDALFSRYIPYLKYRTWQLLKPGIGGRAAAEYANMSLGGQNLMAIGRSRTLQDMMRFVGLAPDFEEGVAKQWGNALFNWHGPQGTMNRMYWGSALVGSAFMLEAGNQLFGGHWSWDNDPSATLQWDLSKLYDTLGWKHSDPVTGQNTRPYFDFMGPWRGQFEALQELGRASAMGAMQLYGTQVPDEIAGSVEKGIPHPDPIGAVGRLLSARSGLLPRSGIEMITGQDYAGRSVDVAGDPALLNTGRRVINALQGALPTGPAQAVAGLKTAQQGLAPALFQAAAGTVGFRTSKVSGPAEGEANIHTSPSRRLTILNQWQKDNGVTPEIQQQLQHERAQGNLEVTNKVNQLLADPTLTPEAPVGQARSAGLISQIITTQQQRTSEYKQYLRQLNQEYGYSGTGPPPQGYEDQKAALDELFGGVIQGGTAASADLDGRPDVDPNQLFQMAWQPQSTSGLPQQLLADLGIQAPDWLPNVGAKIDPNDAAAMAKEHAMAVQKVATDWDVDPAVMEDVVKAHLYGDGKLPALPGMTSAGLDDVASDYWKVGQEPSGPDRTAKQQKVINDAAAAYGVDPDALRQRVVWRGLPMVEQPEALKQYSNATGLDVRSQVFSYANPDGSPWGSLQQEKQANAALEAASRQGRYVPGRGGFPGTYLNAAKDDVDPKLQNLAEARSRGNAAKAAALQADPSYPAYNRFYGRGKYLNNDQWQQFQAGTLDGTFTDIGGNYPNEFKNRINILDKWATMTPEQRSDRDQPTNVSMLIQDPYSGALSRETMTMADAASYLTRAKSAGRIRTGTIDNLNPDEAAADLPG